MSRLKPQRTPRQLRKRLAAMSRSLRPISLWQARFKTTPAQRRSDEVVLVQHELLAPFDARVIARHKELGSIVIAGEPVFTLIAPDLIWVRAFVDEALAGGLSVGQTAFVRLRSEPDRLVETEVVRIDQENDRVTEERRIYVRCRTCDQKHQLRFLGEQAEVQ